MFDDSNHISGVEMIKIINHLKNGKTVSCLSCDKGTYKPVGSSNLSQTNCFKCSNCEEMININ